MFYIKGNTIIQQPLVFTLSINQIFGIFALVLLCIGGNIQFRFTQFFVSYFLVQLFCFDLFLYSGVWSFNEHYLYYLLGNTLSLFFCTYTNTTRPPHQPPPPSTFLNSWYNYLSLNTLPSTISPYVLTFSFLTCLARPGFLIKPISTIPYSEKKG